MVWGMIINALTAAGLIATFLEVFSGQGQVLGQSIRGFLGGLGSGLTYLGTGAGAGFYKFSRYTAKGVEAWLRIGQTLIESIPKVQLPEELNLNTTMPAPIEAMKYSPAGVIAIGIEKSIEAARHFENMGTENRIAGTYPGETVKQLAERVKASQGLRYVRGGL